MANLGVDSLILLLEGAYLSMESLGADLLEKPVLDMISHLSKAEKLGAKILSNTGVIINFICNETNLVPEHLRIKDEDLQRKLSFKCLEGSKWAWNLRIARTNAGGANLET